MLHWQTTRYKIELGRPRIMGIVNVTPDSFSGDGQPADLRAQLAHCERLIGEGADILDIGGESTRPGSRPVPLAEELARVLPLVREAVKLGVPVSVDTGKPQVMAAVLDLGADIINDVWALRTSGALDVVARHPACGLCVMHMHGDPQTMQIQPMTGDAVGAVLAFLRERRDALVARGIAQGRIVLDPGIGFGKTVAQNFALLARQRELLSLGQPLLVGWSRKSALGAALADDGGYTPPDTPKVHENVLPPPPGRPKAAGAPSGGSAPCAAGERGGASLAAALLAIERGARIVRVHDVAATVQAIKIWLAMNKETIS